MNYEELVDSMFPSDELMHVGVGHLEGGHSGRYPWGSGENPKQDAKYLKKSLNKEDAKKAKIASQISKEQFKKKKIDKKLKKFDKKNKNPNSRKYKKVKAIQDRLNTSINTKLENKHKIEANIQELVKEGVLKGYKVTSRKPTPSMVIVSPFNPALTLVSSGYAIMRESLHHTSYRDIYNVKINKKDKKAKKK